MAPPNNVFHCHYSFENPSGLSGFSCTRKKFILPPLSYYNYEIHSPSSDHGWVKAVSERRAFICFESTQLSSFYPQSNLEALNIYHS